MAKEGKYDRVFSFHCGSLVERVLLNYGMIVDESDKRRTSRIVVVTSFLIAIYHVYGSSVVTYMSVINKDSIELLVGSQTLLTAVAGVVKYFECLANQKSFLELAKYIKKYAGPREEFLPEQKLTRFLAIFYVSTIVAICVTWFPAPLISDRLILDVWYPYDTISFVPKYLTVSIQVYNIMLDISSNVYMDITMINTTSTIQRRLLEARDILDSMSEEEESVNNREKLKQVLVIHQEALQVVRELRSVYRNAMLLQVLASVTSICLNEYSFVSLMNNADTPTFINGIMYIGPMLSMHYLFLFLYCWTGQQITNTFEGFHIAIANCKWYACQKSEIYSVSIMVEASRRPVELVGHVFTGNYSTFVEAVRQSYSIFLLLQTFMD